MRTLAPLGELICTVQTFPTFSLEIWHSHPIAVPLFLARPLPFSIDVELEDGNYPADVTEAIERFLALGLKDHEEMTARVYKHYVGIETRATIDVEVPGPDRVWEFAVAEEVCVMRSPKNEEVVLVVVCECEWENEHGFQLVYWQGSRLVQVSPQGVHTKVPLAADSPDAQDTFR